MQRSNFLGLVVQSGECLRDLKSSFGGPLLEERLAASLPEGGGMVRVGG